MLIIIHRQLPAWQKRGAVPRVALNTYNPASAKGAASFRLTMTPVHDIYRPTGRLVASTRLGKGPVSNHSTVLNRGEPPERLLLRALRSHPFPPT